MPSAFLRDYLNELNIIFSRINASEFESLVEELRSAYERQAHIFICGNGGSAATASHFVCDLNKGVSFRRDKRFKVICLNDNMPTVLAYANDVSYDDVFVEQLKNFICENNLVIGLSGSGNSVNVLKAIEYANKCGARSFGICGYGGGKLKETAHKSLVIDSRDMQKVEDIHLVIFHCIAQYFSRLS